jgi:hypothetical protein
MARRVRAERVGVSLLEAGYAPRTVAGGIEAAGLCE